MSIQEIKQAQEKFCIAKKQMYDAQKLLNNEIRQSLNRYVKYLKENEYLTKFISYDFIYDYKNLDDCEIRFEDDWVIIDFTYDHGWCDGQGTNRVRVQEEFLNTELSDEDYAKLFDGYKLRYEELETIREERELEEKRTRI